MIQPSFLLKFIRSDGSQIKESFLVEGHEILVGRNTEAEILLKDPSISRRHLVVTLRDGEIFLEDQETSGGTRVAGVPLKPHQPTKYTPGDAISMGKCEDTFTLELFKNHLTDADLAREVAREATAQAEAMMAEAKAHYESALLRAEEKEKELLEHARGEAEEIQKKAHFELLQAQNEAARQREDLLSKLDQELEKRRKEIEEKLRLESEKLAEDLQKSAHDEALAQKASLLEKWDKERLKELESEKQALREEKELSLKKALQELKENKHQELKELDESLKGLKDQLNSLENDLAEKKEQNKLLEQNLREGNTELESLTSQLASEEATHKELGEKVQALQEQLEKESKVLKERLAAEGEKLQADLEKQIAPLKENVEELELSLRSQTEQLQSGEKALEKLQTKLAKENESLKELQQSRDAIQSECAELEKAREELRLQTSTLEEEHEAYKQQLMDEASREILELRTRAAQELHAQRKKLQSKIAQKEGEVATQIEALKTQRLAELEKFVEKEAKKLKKTAPHKIQSAKDYFVRFLEHSWPQLVAADTFSEVKETLSGELESALNRAFLDADPQSKKETQEHFQLDPELQLKKQFKWKKRVAVCALIGSLVGTAFLLKENFKPLDPEDGASRGPSAAETYALKMIDEKKRVFSPPTTPEHKDTYTKNVLYTTDYTEIFLSKEFQDQWVVAANDFFVSRLGLSDNAIVRFIAKENELVKKLHDIRQGIHPDREVEGIDQLVRTEEEILKDLKIMLEGERRFSQFKEFASTFFNEFDSAKGTGDSGL